jgi:hypothetical protein
MTKEYNFDHINPKELPNNLISMRLNPPASWLGNSGKNPFFLGFLELIIHVTNQIKPKSKMIEIGSYTGESTSMFAASGFFKEIYAIDCALDGEFKHKFEEFEINTRLFNNIKLIKDFSYNVVNDFADESIDFIYIDGNHSFEYVFNEINLYKPKIKKSGIISGHDYNLREVRDAVHKALGTPDITFRDNSWAFHL